MQGRRAAPAARLPLPLRLGALLLLLLPPPPPAAAAQPAEPPPGAARARALPPGGRQAAAAARAALHYRNSRAGSPAALRALGHVRKASVKSIPGIGHKYYLQFTTEDYRTRQNVGNCLATVFYQKRKSPPAVTINCLDTKDEKQIQEEDNTFYQKIKQQTKPIIANDIPDSYGNIEPALEPVWALAVAGSSFIMWEKSTENLSYSMAQVKSVKQWIRKDDSIEFDYTVLLHEIPTQEMILCHMRVIWLPGRTLKVKPFCASDNQWFEEASGMESGSAAGILQEKEEKF